MESCNNVFCEWLLPLSVRFSRFVCVLACMSIDYFMAQKYSIAWIDHIVNAIDWLMDTWVVSAF